MFTIFAGSAVAHEGADDGAHHGAAGALAAQDLAAAPGEPFKVLVFSKTAGFRHDSIPSGITAIQQLATANNFTVDVTEDAAKFTDENLAQYDTVVFLSTTGDVLTETQQAAFERFIRAGGGFTGVHAASDTEYSWPWYGELVGAYFASHPPGTPTATVEVQDKAHPSTAHLPHRWQRTDEWYNFTSNPRGKVHVLATLNESTYSGGTMGNDHPIAWCRDYDGGRSWYTGGGHTQASFSEPLFREHLLRGIQWSAGVAEGDCGGTVWNNFERKTLAEGSTKLGEAIALAAMPDGRVLHTARDGRVFLTNAAGTETKVAASIPVYQHDEDGLQSVALDPNFATNKWVYLYYAPTLNTPGGDAPITGTKAQFDAYKGHNVLSRFKFENDQLVRSS
jgi:type 1 glutamine amidotransferase